MAEKIKANMSIIVNIVALLFIIGSGAVGYGRLQGKIIELDNALHTNKTNIEKRQDKAEECNEKIRLDVGKILIKVSYIEGTLKGKGW